MLPMNNVRALLQTGREKSIANGEIIVKIAGDRDGIVYPGESLSTSILR
jgi:hypothetical protein